MLKGRGFLSEDVRPQGTYKTLAEQREVLTPAEERFERARQTIGLFLGPVAFLVMYFFAAASPEGSAHARRRARLYNHLLALRGHSNPCDGGPGASSLRTVQRP